ncbi:MAG: GNAT family N-acetyltransferase [Chloroflexi bacterium]|nr:GNAT family N-acetyltransferase [Chloroflexota bacterium]
MTDDELLALYDQEQRRNLHFPGMRRELDHEAGGEVVRCVDETAAAQANFVLYSRLTAENADQAIQAQIAYFAALGRSFEWKLYDHDTPPDLRQRLAAHGFAIGEAEAIMALDLQAAPPALLQPVRADVRRLTKPDDAHLIVPIEEAVWGGDRSAWGARLAEEMRLTPDLLSVYLVYVGGVAACAAWINFTPQSQFASLWGGSTRPEFRKMGLYTAVLAARVQEAIRRGYRFLTIDASPMSRPIVARHGFRFLTYSYPCEYE